MTASVELFKSILDAILERAYEELGSDDYCALMYWLCEEWTG